MTKRLAFIIFFTVTCAVVNAQEINNINPIIKIVVGEPFYIHEVLEGQTLEAIADAYAADIEAIRKENPSLTNPLITRINIRIPYTDQSAARIMEVAKQMGLEETVGAKNQRTKEKDEKAFVEAVELLPIISEPIKEEEVLTSEDDELAILKELSQTLSEGLEDLKVLKAEVEEKPVIDKDGFLKEERVLADSKDQVKPKDLPFSGVIDDRVKLFKKEKDESLFLKEYFLLRLNSDGLITNVRDERSETNANTHLLDVNELKGRYFSDTSESFKGMIVPIGINAKVDRIEFDVQVKKGKVKIIDKGFPIQFDHSKEAYVELIRSTKPVETLRGKYRVTIIEGETFISIHDKFEYNPFGIISEVLDERKLLEVEEFLAH